MTTQILSDLMTYFIALVTGAGIGYGWAMVNCTVNRKH